MPFLTIAKNFRMAMLWQPKRYLSVLLFVCIVGSAMYLNQNKTVVLTDSKKIFLEEMTWQEVQQAINQGFTTVLVPTGGTEQNGVHAVLGKHNFIVKYTSGQIAQRLGNTLVAPVMAYVPEGNINPPTEHMRFAGTLSIPESVFAETLMATAQSLKQHGFKTIAFIGDSGGNQAAQQQVAEELSKRWQAENIKVLHINRYYEQSTPLAYLQQQGFSLSDIGQHAGIRDTSELLAVYPEGVRMLLLKDNRQAAMKEGSDGDVSKANQGLGQQLLALKINAAVTQIQQEIEK